MKIFLLTSLILVLSQGTFFDLQASSQAAPSIDIARVEDSLKELKSQAEAGSANAMQQLSRYYAFYGLQDQARQWHERYMTQLQQQAAAQDSKSMLQLAGLYLRGSEFLPPSLDQAQLWLDRAARAGEPSAAYIRADVYEKAGDTAGAKASYLHSYQLYEQRLKELSKQADALYWLAIMELLGQGVEKDVPKALARFEQSAALGSSAALQRLFQCYTTGKDVAKDQSKAMGYARRLADEHADGRMALLLAHAYTDAEGVERDEEKAEHYLDLACKLQVPQAFTYRASKLKAEAQPMMESLQRAAQLADAGVHAQLGEIYLRKAKAEHTDLRDELYDSAQKHLHIAADLYSDPMACYQLSLFYREYLKDEARAHSYTVKASDLGVKEAMAERGLLHMLPHSNIDWNPTLAYQWWQQGSKAGDATATRYLNIFLYGVVPAVLVICFILPILLMRVLLWRSKRKARSNQS